MKFNFIFNIMLKIKYSRYFVKDLKKSESCDNAGKNVKSICFVKCDIYLESSRAII